MECTSENEDSSDSSNGMMHLSLPISTVLDALGRRDMELHSEVDELQKKLSEKDQIVESLHGTISALEARAMYNEAKLAAAMEGEAAARNRAEKLEFDLKALKKCVLDLKEQAKLNEAELAKSKMEEAAAVSRAEKLEERRKVMRELMLRFEEDMIELGKEFDKTTKSQDARSSGEVGHRHQASPDTLVQPQPSECRPS